jgi:mannitol-1-phosphate 5-dehydrogenase
MNKKQAIQIGAGNIGRGLNGFILNKNNYKITFLDISDYLVNLLNKKDFYQVIEINKINVKKRVDNFDSINILDEKSILKNIENYSIFTISIGFNNLIKLKSLFQKIIKKLNKNKIKKYINIIAIENGINASTHLKKIIYSVLTKEEKKYANKYIGFVNCVVDRIVPNNQDKTLNIKVQKYYELILDENS